MSDNASITGASFFRTPKTVAKIIFFLAILVILRICLTFIIKLNASTAGHFGLHCKSVELLYQMRALLTLKDV